MTFYTPSTQGWFLISSIALSGGLLKCRFSVPTQAYRFSLHFNKIPSWLKGTALLCLIIVELPFPESGITNFAFPGSPSTTGPWVAATLCRCGKPFLEKASAPNCTFSTMVSMKYVDLTVTKTWCKDSRAIITATMRPGEGGDKGMPFTAHSPPTQGALKGGGGCFMELPRAPQICLHWSSLFSHSVGRAIHTDIGFVHTLFPMLNHGRCSVNISRLNQPGLWCLWAQTRVHSPFRQCSFWHLGP